MPDKFSSQWKQWDIGETTLSGDIQIYSGHCGWLGTKLDYPSHTGLETSGRPSTSKMRIPQLVG